MGAVLLLLRPRRQRLVGAGAAERLTVPPLQEAVQRRSIAGLGRTNQHHWSGAAFAPAVPSPCTEALLEQASPGYEHAVTARERWHTTLVYFGLRDDPSLAEQLDARPTRGWTAVALLAAVVIGVAVAAGILALAGVHDVWALLGRSVLLLAVGISLWQAFSRFRGRTGGP